MPPHPLIEDPISFGICLWNHTFGYHSVKINLIFGEKPSDSGVGSLECEALTTYSILFLVRKLNDAYRITLPLLAENKNKLSSPYTKASPVLFLSLIPMPVFKEKKKGYFSLLHQWDSLYFKYLRLMSGDSNSTEVSLFTCLSAAADLSWRETLLLLLTDCISMAEHGWEANDVVSVWNLVMWYRSPAF